MLTYDLKRLTYIVPRWRLHEDLALFTLFAFRSSSCSLLAGIHGVSGPLLVAALVLALALSLVRSLVGPCCYRL